MAPARSASASAARVRVQGYDPRKLRRWIRLTGGAPSRSGKDPIAHILWLQEHEPGDRARDVEVPRAEGLVELQAHRRRGRDVRLDRPALGHRQPRPRRASTTTTTLLALVGARPRHSSPTSCRADDVIGDAPARTPRPSSALPAGIPVVGGTPDVQSAAIGSGAVRGLRRPPLRRHVVVDHVPRAVQEDRHPARHRVAAVAACRASTTSPTSRSRPARASNWLRDNVLYPDDALRRDAGPGDVFARIDALAATAPTGQRRRDLHAVAQRRAHARRRPHAPRRLAQPLARDRRGPTWCVPCSKASRSTRAGCSTSVEKFVGRPFPAAATSSAAARSRSSGARSWPTCSTGRSARSSTRSTPTRAVRRCSRALALERLTVDDIGRAVAVTETFQPDPARARSYDTAVRASSARSTRRTRPSTRG